MAKLPATTMPPLPGPSPPASAEILRDFPDGIDFLITGVGNMLPLVGLAIGVLVAAKTGSQRAAMLTAILATMLPSTILSGMVFPIASMAPVLQLVTNVVPARWFIVIARGIMLKGVGLEHLWRETLVLIGMTLFFMTVAVRSFKARIA